MASTADRTLPWAVMTMTAVSGASVRSRDRTSRPSRPGIRTSRKARSKASVDAWASAVSPSSTTVTAWPAWRRSRSRSQRIEGSSSATRMRAVIRDPPHPPTRAAWWSAGAGDGQVAGEARALAGRARHAQGAPVLLDDPMGDGEAEAEAPGLGRDERVEHAVEEGTGNPLALVGDQHLDEGPGPRAHVDLPVHRVEGDPRRQGKPSPARHGLDPVLDEVLEDLG